MFERKGSGWRQIGSTIDVRVGRAGLAWGRGLTDVRNLAGPIKKEGDDRAPAGVFRLSSVFGWNPKSTTKMPFIEITPHTICVDDSRSPYYNHVFNELEVVPWNWRHAENFSLIGAYRMGVIVEHNIPPKPGAGSCIFLHIWESPTTSTSGCTAMTERELNRIIQWLDPAKHPLLVQLPRPAYDKLKPKWRMP